MAQRSSPYGLMDIGPMWTAPAPNSTEGADVQSMLRGGEHSKILSPMERLSIDELLVKRTRAICERYRIHFADLSSIQRKFLTHYRCSQCGLLPLYHINLLHVKRVRCRQCGQLISFTNKGKYGKIRKEIALDLAKEAGRYDGNIS